MSDFSTKVAGISALSAVLLGLPMLAVADPQAIDLNDPETTPQDLAEAIAGEQGTVSDVTFSGDGRAAGLFSGAAATGVGIGDGAVLSTGAVESNLPAEDSEFLSSDSFNSSGDSLLGQAINETDTNDAAVLEFTLTAGADVTSVQFDFVLASFESPGSFNDGFALWVNGANCALFPDNSPATQTNMANFQRFGFNDSPLPQGSGRPRVSELQTCETNVAPGSSNEIRLAIGDVGDNSVDTYALVRAGQDFASGLCDPDDPDTIIASDAGNEFVLSDTGQCVEASGGNNQLVGGTGDDEVLLGAGDDEVIMNAGGNNLVLLGAGNNVFVGGPGDDEVFGQGNNEIVLREGGNNQVRLTGGGTSRIVGGPGNDVIDAGPGEHIIIGGDGANSITVGQGSSIIIGGRGDNDTCIGPPETTTFIGCENINPEGDGGDGDGDGGGGEEPLPPLE